MGVVQAVVRLPFTTNLPADVAENTFWFASPTETAQDLAEGNIVTRLASFYNSVAGGGTRPVAAYLSPVVSRAANACTITFRELFNDQTLSEPLVTPPDEFTLGPVGAGSTYGFPNEVALCLSYRSTVPPVPGLPVARRRGRIYLGPLGVLAAGTPTASEIRPAADFLTDVAVAGGALSVTSNDTDGNWVVYSRSSNVFSVIDTGFVDDAWDTQRRRELDATTRTIW